MTALGWQNERKSKKAAQRGTRPRKRDPTKIARRTPVWGWESTHRSNDGVQGDQLRAKEDAGESDI